mmetsp:Transcript_144021/g.460936  ORF Transcript_144021/g.460936 Transcript_144021/m.460936 type:complete len:320 (-) Transcript_144021:35-994(-)
MHGDQELDRFELAIPASVVHASPTVVVTGFEFRLHTEQLLQHLQRIPPRGGGRQHQRRDAPEVDGLHVGPGGEGLPDLVQLAPHRPVLQILDAISAALPRHPCLQRRGHRMWLGLEVGVLVADGLCEARAAAEHLAGGIAPLLEQASLLASNESSALPGHLLGCQLVARGVGPPILPCLIPSPELAARSDIRADLEALRVAALHKALRGRRAHRQTAAAAAVAVLLTQPPAALASPPLSEAMVSSRAPRAGTAAAGTFAVAVAVAAAAHPTVRCCGGKSPTLGRGQKQPHHRGPSGTAGTIASQQAPLPCSPWPEGSHK